MASSFPAIDKEQFRLLLFSFGVDSVGILNLGGSLAQASNPGQEVAKRRSKVRQLTAALESGRAEAKPGAKFEFGKGVPILEAQRAGRAVTRSLRRSAPRRAAAKAKGRAYKARTVRKPSRTGGR